MLLVDDILLLPARSLLWIFREIHNRACEEVANAPEEIAQQLRSLYMQLETSAISEEQFETQEKKLLDRLDEVETRSGAGQEEEELPSDDVLEEVTAHDPRR